MIAIIDYDAGNLKSVKKACEFLGHETVITNKRDEILNADKIILPGVGAFGDAMNNLKKFGLVDIIKEAVDSNIPFLGICLGLQLLFESSEESPNVDGLGILKGKIVKLRGGVELKIPHMGWNSLDLHNNGKLFRGIEEGSYVYFVHSYYLQADEEEIVKATAEYGVTIHASVEKNNIFACQFHPEKSGRIGLQILRNFCEM